MTLPDALKPFTNYRQFITYTVKPSSTRPGKTDKLPTNYKTGQIADAHDPNMWTDYATAYERGNGNVGFVITENDPFWFLDIDNCLLPTGWSPLAIELVNLLAGCAVEVSWSGKGLHLFGSGTVPKHSTRGPAGTGIEFYTKGRFVALGKHPGTRGDANKDCGDALKTLVNKYFNRVSDSDIPPEWTTAPISGYGIADDEELLRRAFASKSAGGVFGIKASFSDLWDNNTLVLKAAFPDSGERQYDCSSADAALAQHLAFWTANNCDQILRLMHMSKLKRDKWDRVDYMQRTILSAISKQKEWYKNKPSVPLDNSGKIRDVIGDTFLNADGQKIMFEGCTYIADSNRILMPGGHAYKQEQFDAMLGGYNYVISGDNGKVTKSAWEAFTRSQLIQFPKAHTATFRPDLPPGAVWKEDGDIHANSYWPIPVKTVRGNERPFKDHLVRLLPNELDREIITAYMAAIVQYPGIKFQWCPLIQGVEGNGKTLLSRCVAAAVGAKHSHTPKAEQITEKYNDWLENKIFIGVEDIYVPHDKQEVIEILKPMITSDELEIRSMGRDKVTKRVCCNFILNSNHKDAIRKNKNDRRFAPFFTAQQAFEDLARDGMGGNYFPMLYDWLKHRDGYAIVTDYLKNYKIPDELNPAGICHRAPITSSTREAIENGLGTIEQEIMGAILEDRPGFRGGWISSHFMDILLRESGYKLPRNKRKALLEGMGYIPHPGLPEGQVHNAVNPDMCKPRLFILPTHESIGSRGASVCKEYEAAQIDKGSLMKLVL